MANEQKVLGVVIALSLAAAVFGYVAIPALSATYSDQTDVYNQSVGDEVTVVSNVTSNVTAVETTNATYELTDTNTSTSFTLTEGETKEVQMTEGTINVTLNQTVSGAAETEYTYSNTYGWGDGATNVVGLIGIFFILGVGLWMAAPAIDEL